MSSLETAALLLGVLLASLLSGVWIFAALIVASMVVLLVAMDMSMLQVGSLLRATLWRSLTSWELTAVPIFIFMGELFFLGGLSKELFLSLNRTFSRIAGGVLHVNVWGSALFAAISGSSTATMMTIGRVTVPELRRLGYSEGVSYGSLAGAGTLGILVPPSIPLIIYGILAGQSITKMFAAGILPGLLVSALFTLYIVAISYGPSRSLVSSATEPHVSAAGSDAESRGSAVPTLVIVGVVFGGIYSGFVTATEAAVLGVTATLTICLWKKTLTMRILWEVMQATIGTSANILIIVASAAFLSSAVSALGIPQFLIGLIAEFNLTYPALILVLAFLYLVMGMFIDGLSMMVITIPIVLPVVVAAGGDPIWFGIFLVLMIELGLLTPPVGVHLFVLQSMSGRSLSWTAKVALPFTMLLGLATLIVALIPQLALYLPTILN